MRPGYFSWQQSDVTVLVRHSVMESLADQVESAPGQAAHGILIGSAVHENGHTSIIVESAEDVVEPLEAQLESLRHEGLVVAGFYRSQTRGAASANSALLTADLDLLAARLGDHPGVFLLLRPLSAMRMLGDVWLWRDKASMPLITSVPFPFDDGSGRVLQPGPGPVATPAQPEPWLAWLYIALFAVLGGIVGQQAVIYLAGGGARGAASNPAAIRQSQTACLLCPGPEPASDAGFHLVAERDRDRLVLRWNPATPSVRSLAQAGVVIQDGGHQTRYTLDRSQLQAGGLVYVPSTSNVTFQVEAAFHGFPLRETLTVIDPSLDYAQTR